MKKCLLSIALCSVSLVCLAGFNEGVTAYEKGDYQTALKAWKAIAEQKPTVTGGFEWHSSQSKNTVEAQYALALLYWQGKGVKQNYQEAEKWLVLAATSGHSEAQLKLAYLYLEGLSGKANTTEASKWFEKSAQQGNVNAQYNLGLLYWRGIGVMQDSATAKKWLTAAASQGDDSAKELLVEVNAAPVQTADSDEEMKAINAQNAPPAKPPVAPAAVPVVANNDAPEAVDAPSTPPAITPNEPPVAPAAVPVVANNDAPKAVDAPSTPPTIMPNVPQAANAQTPPVATQLSAATPAATTQIADAPSAPINDYYAVQLIGSPKQDDVQQFMASWRDTLSPLVMTDKIKKSERIFVVVYGNYPSSTEAKQAIAGLPAELRKSKPWVVKMHGEGLAP